MLFLHLRQHPSPAGPSACAPSSDTANYVSNLAGHPVYMIHGTADDNVLLSGEYMFDLLDPITDVTFISNLALAIGGTGICLGGIAWTGLLSSS